MRKLCDTRVTKASTAFFLYGTHSEPEYVYYELSSSSPFATRMKELRKLVYPNEEKGDPARSLYSTRTQYK